ncbi:MAG: hypothetical protein RLZZ479_1559 [Bacteroidota bacterium]
MVDEIARYSEADLAEFKELILKKIQKAQEDLDLIKSAYMKEQTIRRQHSKRLKKVVKRCLRKRTHN